MANPKKHHSASRRDKRRANWKLVLPSLSKCPQCGALKRPHQACPSCGTYAGRVVFSVEEKKKPGAKG